MKANEFVKKFGVNKAKALLSTQGKTIANLKSEYAAEQLKEYQGYIVSDDLMSLVELKRLVESHELVEKFGGLAEAKKIANNPLAIFNTMPLKQAIADVESCL
ncbi:hypothetical protein [Acinetobacter towneri]|uniref:hypothetical protein n=1 Tax=Acinetobacter towneri TaxID=202956 RepID=UPI001F620718|nr:hypothetical protein [Acinetobacter towneri]UNT61068.1 hypothetical protein IHE36_08880 [Acinetobacter towneri]